MPYLLWRSLQSFGYTTPPTYVGKECEENGIATCTVHVNVPANYSVTPEWESWTVTVVGSALKDTWEMAAFKALTHFCEIRKHEVAGTTLAMLPITDLSDFEWNRRMDLVFRPNHRDYIPPLATTAYYGISLFQIIFNLRRELSMYRDAYQSSEEKHQVKDAEIATLKIQIQTKDEDMEEIIEERDNAQNDAASFEEQMIEAQDDLDAFKAARLP